VGETFSPVKFMGAIGIINQSIEAIKERILDCKINSNFLVTES
jgi:hypothetical protein